MRVSPLDLVVAAAVEEGPRVAPPSAPQVGETYIVDFGGTGAWLGRDSCLAGFTDAGWKFVAPREGTIAYVASMAVWTVFRGGAWEMGTLRGNSLLIGGEQVVANHDPRPGQRREIIDRHQLDLEALRLQPQRLVGAEPRDQVHVAIQQPVDLVELRVFADGHVVLGQAVGLEQRQQRIPG